MSGAQFSDLKTRIGSAIVMVAVTIGALYAPPQYGLFALLLLVVITLGFWELAKLCEPEISALRRTFLALSPLIATILGAVAMIAASLTIEAGGLLMGGVMLAIVMLLMQGDRLLFIGYGTLIALAISFLFFLYSKNPLGPLALIAVIAASDVAGYFGGRILGGPKFWPRVSPKKTWSGTVAGWIASAIVGMILVGPISAIAPELKLSLLHGLLIGAGLSFAGQLGDIFESAMKRKAGVKDASNLIPGHGGVLDRLDAVIMAAALAYVVMLLVRAL